MSKWAEAIRVRDAAREYLDLTDMPIAAFAGQVGHPVYSVARFLKSEPTKALIPWPVITAIREFIERRPVRTDFDSEVLDDPWVTASSREVHACLLRAIAGEVVLLYGAPGTQKTSTLKRVICQRNRARQTPAIYVYSSAGMSAPSLLKRIGREIGVPIAGQRERLITALVDSLREKPAAIVLDEAQHLSVDCLEIVRELSDRSGCGLLLCGSHQLYLGFTRTDRRLQLEQWLSRVEYKAQLPGLTQEEIRTIAAPFGLPGRALDALIKECAVHDVFAGNKVTYFSARRLAHKLRVAREEFGSAKVAAD